MSEQLNRLEALLEAAAARLPDVTIRRLFGCRALYRTNAVFALVWKAGRIGVKLPVPARYQELMSLAGTAPWVAHAVMSHWVLVPKSFHEDSVLLRKWVKIAHGLAGGEPISEPERVKAKGNRKAPSPIVRTVKLRLSKTIARKSNALDGI
jgi:hypothetical protein